MDSWLEPVVPAQRDQWAGSRVTGLTELGFLAGSPQGERKTGLFEN
jgi:hypothetical protein